MTFDEPSGSLDQNIATIVGGSRVKRGFYTQRINHYSALRTITDAMRVAAIGKSRSVQPAIGIWRTAVPWRAVVREAGRRGIAKEWNSRPVPGVIVAGLRQQQATDRSNPMKKFVLAAALIAALATPALARQCPGLMKKIDAAMATAQVDEATKTKVMALYETGKTAHAAGDHAASEADLNEALKLLGM